MVDSDNTTSKNNSKDKPKIWKLPSGEPNWVDRATVIYIGNHNTSGTVPSEKMAYKPNESASVAGQGSLVKTRYTFSGWTPNPDYTFLGLSSDGGVTLLTNVQLASIVITGNITYKAYFQPPVTVNGSTAR